MIEFKLVPYIYRVKKNGLYPVYLRVTQYKTVKIFYTKIDCTEAEYSLWDYNNEKFDSKKPEFKRKNLALSSFKNSMTNHYYQQLSPSEQKNITIDEYLEIINPTKPKAASISSDVFQIIDYKVKSILDSGGSIRTANQYNDLKRTIQNFLKTIKESKIDIKMIDEDCLFDFQTFQSASCNNNSISVRMRALRTIWNLAIAKNLASSANYPFSKTRHDGKYVIPKSGKGGHRAINIDEFNRFENNTYPPHSKIDFAKDMFVFSYYTGGMNFIDLSFLSLENIVKDRIVYLRSKTGQNFNIPILEPAKKIIEKYENRRTTKYLFPILVSETMTELQIFYRQTKVLKEINKNIRGIAEECKIETHLTTYVARHSMASNLYKQGMSLETLRQLLNHDNIETTKRYIENINHTFIDDSFNLLLQNKNKVI
jgi:site-specific recombinase XerD